MKATDRERDIPLTGTKEGSQEKDMPVTPMKGGLMRERSTPHSDEKKAAERERGTLLTQMKRSPPKVCLSLRTKKTKRCRSVVVLK